MSNTIRTRKGGLSIRSGAKEKAIGVTIVLVVVLIAASFWMGHVIEQRIRKEVEHANQSGLKVALVDYRGGIFGATAQTEFILTSPAGEEVRIPFHHKIQHGPLPTLTAAGRIHSELMLQPAQLAQIKDAFGVDAPENKTPPLVVDTTVGWGGSTRARFELMLDKLAFRGSGAMGAFDLESLRVSGDVSTNSETLSTTININASKINTEGERKGTITQPTVAIRLENVDVQALTALSGDPRKDQDEEQPGQPGQPGEDVDDELSSFFPLLQRGPSLSIQKLSAHWPEGDLVGNFRITYKGTGKVDSSNPPALSDVSADLQFSLPRALAERLTTMRISEQISDEVEDGEVVDVEKETTTTTDRELARMITNGLIVEKDGQLTLDAALRNGELTLNGKPRQLIELLGLLPEKSEPDEE